MPKTFPASYIDTLLDGESDLAGGPLGDLLEKALADCKTSGIATIEFFVENDDEADEEGADLDD